MSFSSENAPLRDADKPMKQEGMETLHIPPLARRGGTKAAGWLVGDSMRKRASLWERRNCEKVRVKTFYNQ
ncbi:hypothetical protein [Chromobacterium piscinae]